MKTDKSQECHIICTVHSKREHREAVKALLLELVEPARMEDGCLYYDLYQQIGDRNTFFILDGWASEEAVALHTAHPNVPRVVEQLKPLLASPLVVITSSRVSGHSNNKS